MLYWLFVILLAVSIVISYFEDKYLYSQFSDFLMAFFYGVLLVSTLALACLQISGRIEAVEYQETYKTLVYKAESEECRDEFGLLNKQIVDEIQKYNETIAFKKHFQRDFWIGIFIPNVYDELETIDLKSFKGG